MATKKLSQIDLALAPPATSDTLVGVSVANNDLRYTLAQVGQTITGSPAGSIPPMIDAGAVYVSGTPSTFTYTIPNGVWHVTFTDTMALTSGTITLPSAPFDGQIVRFKTMQAINSLTVVPNAGQNLITGDFPPEMPQFTYFEVQYRASNATWYLEFFEGALITLTAPLTLYVSILAGTIVAGSGYVSGTYIDVPLTGGTGTGAKADITVTAGAVQFVVTSTGDTGGYHIGDVLSASNTNLGGSGSGFTFTITAIGNDLQNGETLAQSFRTLQHAYNTVATFNLAQGWLVNINISDGRYNECLVLGPVIGASPGGSGSFAAGQIHWNGNSYTQCHIKPNFNLGARPVILSSGAIGNAFFGIWVDGTDPGFADWWAYRDFSGNNYFENCRMSLPDNGDWDNINVEGGGKLTTNFLFVDMGGSADSLAIIGQDARWALNGGATLLSTTPTSVNFFVVARAGGEVNLFFDPSGWSGFGGVSGPKGLITTGGSITAQLADTNSIPGSLPIVLQDANSSLGSRNLVHPTSGTGIEALGTPTFSTLPATTTGQPLVFPDTWAFIRTALGNTGRNRYIAVNDNGNPFYYGLYGTNTQTANYTLAQSDANNRIEMNVAGANTVTVPTNATVYFPVGCEIKITQIGAGATTIAAAGGVTGHNFGALAGQWASVKLYQRAIDEWVQTSG